MFERSASMEKRGTRREKGRGEERRWRKREEIENDKGRQEEQWKEMMKEGSGGPLSCTQLGSK